MIANALSIAGSDPSGGAGIQADLKTFSACGTYGMAALTALTVQNTQGVSGVHLVPAGFVTDQIREVFDDIQVSAVKIGMIANSHIAQAVALALGPHKGMPIVLDPVMVAKGGASLLDQQAVRSVREALMPLASHVTPNLPEAAALLDTDPATNRKEMLAQAEALLDFGPRAVLLKGGHLDDPDSPDVMVTAQGAHWLSTPRIETANTHGTGCTLSAALAAELAKGADDLTAFQNAKAFVNGAIAHADDLNVGSRSGHGPTHHFHALWAQPSTSQDPS